MAIIVLAGKTGSGKDTICNALLEASAEGELNNRIDKIITTTTRQPREGEVDGREYNFITNDEFEEKIKNGEIFEYREYDSSNGKVYYGSEKIDLFAKDRRGDYITILDLEGAKAYQDAYGKENVFVVEIDAPEKIRKDRITGRAEDRQKAEDEWSKRNAKDIYDFNSFSRSNVVNYTADNSAVDFGAVEYYDAELEETVASDKEAYLNDVIGDIIDAFELYKEESKEILRKDPDAWIRVSCEQNKDDGSWMGYHLNTAESYDIDSMALDYAHLYVSMVSPEEYLIYQDKSDNVSEEERKEIFNQVRNDLDEVADTFRDHLIANELMEEKAFLDDLLINADPNEQDYNIAKEILNNIDVYNNYLDSKEKRVLDIDEEDLYRKASEIAERVVKWTERLGNAFGSDTGQPLNDIKDEGEVYTRIIDRQFKEETEYIERIVALLSELNDADLTDEQRAIIEEGKALVKDLCKIDLELAMLEAQTEKQVNQAEQSDCKDEKTKKKNTTEYER